MGIDTSKLQGKIAELKQSSAQLEEAVNHLGSQSWSVEEGWDEKIDIGIIDIPTVDLTAPWEETTSEIRDRFDAVLERVDELGDSLESFEETVDQFREHFSGLQEKLSEALDGSQDKVTESLDAVLTGFEEDLDELLSDSQERLAELGEALLSHVEEKIKTQLSDTLDELKETLENEIEKLFSNLGEVSEAVKDSIALAFETLAEETGTQAKEAMEELGRELLDLLANELVSEAMESVTTTQIGAQVTAILQPYLPQIMIANALAPAIQTALNTMRMGI